MSFGWPPPHKAVNRHIGSFAVLRVSPQGQIISETEGQAHARQWLPTEEDRAYVASLMGRVVEPGKMANWIAPPPIGITRQPIDFEYVRFNCRWTFIGAAALEVPTRHQSIEPELFTLFKPSQGYCIYQEYLTGAG